MQLASAAEPHQLLVSDIQVCGTGFLDEFDQSVDGLTHDSSFCVRDAG